MLLGTDELTILRGSKFYGTWKWVNSVTGDAENFEGLTAKVKIKNIHEDFVDYKNTWEVGTSIVEPLDIDGNAFKGRVDIELSKEDTLKFAIPLHEEDKYGASDYYAVLEITLNTGEVILQAKVKVVDSLEAETLNFFLDEKDEAIIINAKLDDILLNNADFVSQRDAYIEDLEVAQTEVTLQLSEITTKHSQVNQMKSDVEDLKVEVENIFDNFDDRYLGPKASDPILDNDGDALVIGQIYYSTADKRLRFYNGTSWDSPVLAAQTYANNANTSATNANQSRIDAQTAKTESTAQAVVATTQAGISTTKANEAVSSASSALSSKNASATSATNSATSAAASLASKNASATSEANALTYRNQAEGFKNSASTSASTATTQAGISSTKAGEAKTSELNASSSEANALIYRNQAEGFRDEINPELILSKIRMSQILNITGA